jgi:hypothetical protein
VSDSSDAQWVRDALAEWNESGRPIVIAGSSGAVSFHPLFAALLEAQRAARLATSGAAVDPTITALLCRTGRL